MRSGILLFFLWAQSIVCYSQSQWDTTAHGRWPSGFRKVDIISTADHSLQPSVIYKSTKPGMPLIVSLHTWSGDFLQDDSLSYYVKDRNWNYIHPDFRGPNKNSDACGSRLVIADISDAIIYALSFTKADPSEIHIVGVSGGGFATMLCYMKLKLPIKSFSSWVGISDLKAWYYETKGRNLPYAQDILACTGDTTTLNIKEVEERSPFYCRNPDRKSDLFLYAGIHDGYTGSVPVTQSIKFFNRLVSDYKDAKPVNLVSESTQVELLTKRSMPGNNTGLFIRDRKLHYFIKYRQVRLSIFEGGHEQIVSNALDLLPVFSHVPDTSIRIVCLGDSNGEIPDSWPMQLSQIYAHGRIINFCRSGNTISMDNNGTTDLNEAWNVQHHLDLAVKAWNGNNPDAIVIMLGTNDTKRVFENSPESIAASMDILIGKIKNSGVACRKLVLIAPPLISKEADQGDKYFGAARKLQESGPLFHRISRKYNCEFIDAGRLFGTRIGEYTTDGIHLTRKAQEILAREIAKVLD